MPDSVIPSNALYCVIIFLFVILSSFMTIVTQHSCNVHHIIIKIDLKLFSYMNSDCLHLKVGINLN